MKHLSFIQNRIQKPYFGILLLIVFTHVGITDSTCTPNYHVRRFVRCACAKKKINLTWLPSQYELKYTNKREKNLNNLCFFAYWTMQSKPSRIFSAGNKGMLMSAFRIAFALSFLFINFFMPSLILFLIMARQKWNQQPRRMTFGHFFLIAFRIPSSKSVIISVGCSLNNLLSMKLKTAL